MTDSGRTDYKIPAIWVLALVASYVAWASIPILLYVYRNQPEALTVPIVVPGIIATTLSLVGLLGLAGFAFSTLSAYLVYLLVNRRNMHFAREEALFWTALQRAKDTARQDDLKTKVALGSAEHDLVRLSETAREHSAFLWALLTLVPYVDWIALTYVLAFLTNDFQRHEQREDLFLQGVSGLNPALPQRFSRISRRPVILHILLSVATAGVFLVPWIYLATKDPEAHFEYHRILEPVMTPSMAFPGGTS